MTPSRRQLLLAATGTALLAGCIGDATDPNGTDNPGSGDDDTNNCEPIELSRSDTPPHEPTPPPLPDDIDDQDDWDDHFLGEGMDNDSPVAFSTINVTFETPPIDTANDDTDHLLNAELFTEEDAFLDAVEPVSEDDEDAITAIDFDEQAVVLIVSGFGSSSVGHEWVRVEENCEELHLHGYYRWPYIQTSDYTTRTSAVVVDRPAEHDLDRVWVSLTIADDTRINVSTDDEGIDLDPDDNGADLPGPIEDYETLSVTRDNQGDWWRDVEDGPGIVVTLPDEDAIHSAVEVSDEVTELINNIDFDADNVYLIELVGPNACYQAFELDELVVVTNDQYHLEGVVEIIDNSADDVDCAQVISYQTILLRVTTGVDISEATFRLTDGWGNEDRITAIDLGEFAKE